MPSPRKRRSPDAGLRDMDIVAFVPTTDPARSRSFFETTLGLRFMGGDPFAQVFDAHGVSLRAASVPAKDFHPAPFTILGWAVPEIDAAVTELVDRGVQFARFTGMQQDAKGIWTSPSGARIAWFKDPDGNVLSLTQYQAEE